MDQLEWAALHLLQIQNAPRETLVSQGRETQLRRQKMIFCYASSILECPEPPIVLCTIDGSLACVHPDTCAADGVVSYISQDKHVNNCQILWGQPLGPIPCTSDQP